MGNAPNKKVENGIDIVITWVDGSDENWRKKKAEWKGRGYQTSFSRWGTSEVRYRDWGLLPYLFRGIELYAPWAGTIHFVTAGQVPKWLNVDHPRLRVVSHDEFMPSRYLPTFSSRAIEFCFPFIQGLSERFVYFNDDMYLLNPTEATDFFAGSLPKLVPSENTAAVNPYNPYFAMQIHAGVINRHFSKREVWRRDWRKWLSPKIDRRIRLENLLLRLYPTFRAFRDDHLPSPYLKSTIQRLWEVEPELLEYACSQRFRTLDGVNIWLAKDWQLATGQYDVASGMGALLPCRDSQGMPLLDKTVDVIVHGRQKSICLNDHDFGEDELELWKTAVQDAFATRFPHKSSFER